MARGFIVLLCRVLPQVTMARGCIQYPCLTSCLPFVVLLRLFVCPYRIPWQGGASNVISQYDVRIHLDYISDYSKLPEIK